MGGWMSVLRVSLLGKFKVRSGQSALDFSGAHKAQEMLCYLLLYRHRPHRREALTDLLWPTGTAAQSPKYLRQTLWQLRTVLETGTPSVDGSLLQVDLEWIGIDPQADVWLDVAAFERVCTMVQGRAGQDLQASQAQAIQEALRLYRGDLLEGWDQDWCIFERERLRQMYLALVEKRMAYCEQHGEYEAGLEAGLCALRYENAHERIHRRLMRLYYLNGNRTAALRQYERCVDVLRRELGVGPSPRTIELYQEICSAAALDPGPVGLGGRRDVPHEAIPTLRQAIEEVEQLRTMCTRLLIQLQETIDTVDPFPEDPHLSTGHNLQA